MWFSCRLYVGFELLEQVRPEHRPDLVCTHQHRLRGQYLPRKQEDTHGTRLLGGLEVEPFASTGELPQVPLIELPLRSAKSLLCTFQNPLA